MPASGGRLIQHPQGEYARRLCAVSSLPTSRPLWSGQCMDKEATMSTFYSDDMPGYLLPEDSQFRLKKLRDYTAFLSRLARPRSSDEVAEGAPEVRMDELAICLELLSEQVTMVLDEVSWPAQRHSETAASDIAPADSPQFYGAATEG